jgi:hypothetical protein
MGKQKAENYGNQFGKPDLARIGLFSEAQYISVNEPFSSKKMGDQVANLVSSLEARQKGKQFLTSPPRRGHDTNDVYFSPHVRLFEGEQYMELNKIKRQSRIKSKEQNVSEKPFKPSSVPPKP